MEGALTKNQKILKILSKQNIANNAISILMLFIFY